MSALAPLLVFDSGVGGFSILSHLRTYDVPLLYYADQANFPYGDKSESWLKQRFTTLASEFAQQDLSGLVLACNTGTVAGISTWRTQLNCPIFGVEPVTKMLKHHASPVVWGTAVTTQSQRAASLRATHGAHIRYYTPVGLASAIEHQDQVAIARILRQVALDLQGVDAIGLSCTHYPLILPTLKEYFPNVMFYDPAPAVAKHVTTTLSLRARPESTPVSLTFHSSGSVLRLKQQAETYL